MDASLGHLIRSKAAHAAVAAPPALIAAHTVAASVHLSWEEAVLIGTTPVRGTACSWCREELRHAGGCQVLLYGCHVSDTSGHLPRPVSLMACNTSLIECCYYYIRQAGRPGISGAYLSKAIDTQGVEVFFSWTSKVRSNLRGAE